MRPFNLEEAKAGHPVCTRAGDRVRILCFDLEGSSPIVVAIYKGNDELCQLIGRRRPDGKLDGSLVKDDPRDLMMETKKYTRWVNIYKYDKEGTKHTTRNVWDTKEEGEAYGKGNLYYVTTVPIVWEE